MHTEKKVEYTSVLKFDNNKYDYYYILGDVVI